MAEPVGDENTGEGSRGSDDEADRDNQSIAAVATNSKKPDSERQKCDCQRASNKSTPSVATIVEIFVGVALVVVGYLQYRVYTRQAGIMETQTKLTEAGERPWVRQKLLTPKPIFIDDSNLSFGIDFTFVNSGQYPAFEVSHELRLAPDVQAPTGLYDAQDKLCAKAESMQKKSPESNLTIFPKEIVEPNLGYGIGVPPYAYTFGDGSNKIVIPILLGCIVYKGATDVLHHTVFAYRVFRKGSGSIQAITQTIPPKMSVSNRQPTAAIQPIKTRQVAQAATAQKAGSHIQRQKT